MNGEPAVLLWVRERLETIFVYSVEAEQITSISALRTLEKLAVIQRQLQ